MQAPSTQRLTVGRYINLHLFDIMDGSPHRAPPSNAIRFSMAARVHSFDQLLITGSRLAMCVSWWEARDLVWRMLVWDWKTGDLVSIP